MSVMARSIRSILSSCCLFVTSCDRAADDLRTEDGLRDGNPVEVGSRHSDPVTVLLAAASVDAPASLASPEALDRLRERFPETPVPAPSPGIRDGFLDASVIARTPGDWWPELPAGVLPAPFPSLDDEPTVWCARPSRRNGSNIEVLLLEPADRRGRWSIVVMHTVELGPGLADPTPDASAILICRDDHPIMELSQGMRHWATWVDGLDVDVPLIELECSHGGTAFPRGLLEWWRLDDDRPRLVLGTRDTAMVLPDAAAAERPRAEFVAMLFDCGASSIMIDVHRWIDLTGDHPEGLPMEPTAAPTADDLAATVEAIMACLGDAPLEDLPLCECADALSMLAQWCIDGHAEVAWRTLRSLDLPATSIAMIGLDLQSMLDSCEVCQADLQSAPRWSDPIPSKPAPDA